VRSPLEAGQNDLYLAKDLWTVGLSDGRDSSQAQNSVTNQWVHPPSTVGGPTVTCVRGIV